MILTGHAKGKSFGFPASFAEIFVSDSRGKPAKVSGSFVSSTIGEDGNYSIDLSGATDSNYITIRGTGLELATVPFTTVNCSSSNCVYNWALNDSGEVLPEVVITAKRKKMTKEQKQNILIGSGIAVLGIALTVFLITKAKTK